MLIRVIDLESTGFTPPDAAVCEIGFCDLQATRTDLAGSPAGWEVVGGYASYVDPGRPIPPEVSAIHHIVAEDVAGALPWPVAAMPICNQAFVDGIPVIAWAAHNARFERQWIGDDLTAKPMICTYKAALRLWPDAPSHSNQALRYWRRPAGIDRQIADIAHRAGPDAYVTAHLLRDMLNDGATVEQLIEWSTQPALQVRCHLGQYRGMKWIDVPTSFLSWVSSKDFSEDVLFTVRSEMQRRRDEAEASHAREVDDLRPPEDDED